jgi:hypothetical protein
MTPLERTAVEYCRQLIDEGWPRAEAKARARELLRDANGHRPNRSQRRRGARMKTYTPHTMPEPKLSRDWQLRLLAELVESRNGGES